MHSTGVGLAISFIVLGASPAALAQQRCAPYLQVFEPIRESCLSNQSTSAGLKAQGAFDILKRAVSGELSFTNERVVGARKDLDDALQLPENNAIRECLGDFRKALLDCVAEEIRLRSDAFPDSIELQFTLASSGRHVDFLFEDRIVLGVKAPPRFRPEQQLVRDASGLFVEDIAAPRQGRAFNAFVSRAVREGFVANAPPAMTEICLERSASPPAAGNLFSRLVCVEGLPCDKFHPLDPGWLVACARRTDTAPTRASRLAMLLGAPALAQPQSAPASVGPKWYVPSLATLESRSERDFAGTGYTMFEIAGPMPREIDADGVALDLEVNDTPVLVDGLPGELRTQSVRPGEDLRLKFALQTLDFDGRHGGCDLIHATLRFYRDGKLVSAEYRLTRPYVALRDPDPVTVTAEGSSFAWSGAYRRPTIVNEHQVFVNSLRAASWEDREGMARARANAQRLQKALTKLGLRYEGKPVVGVVRPGLTQPSYGLALGLVQPTQQIQFTFSSATAAALKAQMMQLRRERADVRAVTNADAFIYKLGHDVPAPSVCGHLPAGSGGLS